MRIHTKIYYTIKRYIINTKDFFHYDISRGIRNLVRWFPIIWKDRNYDQYFIYVLLHKKLSLTEKCLRNGYHLYAEKTADQIKLCVLLLDRLIKDEYHLHAHKRHDEKWGGPELQFYDLEDQPGYSGIDISHKNVKTKKDEELERKDFKRACNHQEQLIEQDLDMLFKTMRKHIRGWWD